jgi:hypothetical protein
VPIAIGNFLGPVLLGRFFDSIGRAIGYYIGAGLVIAAGLVESSLGVDAERRSLEDIATPLSTSNTSTAKPSNHADNPP